MPKIEEKPLKDARAIFNNSVKKRDTIQTVESRPTAFSAVVKGVKNLLLKPVEFYKEAAKQPILDRIKDSVNSVVMGKIAPKILEQMESLDPFDK